MLETARAFLSDTDEVEEQEDDCEEEKGQVLDKLAVPWVDGEKDNGAPYKIKNEGH